MPNQEKLPRAWVYARIPGDCAATRASYDACCRQAGDDGCTVVGGSIDYKGHGPLRDGYQSMLRSIRDGKVNCVYVCRMRQISGKERYLYAFFKCAMRDLLTAVKNERLYPIIYVTALYGLRRSEVLGLKWDSINFAMQTAEK